MTRGVFFGLVFLTSAAVAGAQEHAHEELVVSAEWLREHLHDENLVLLHAGPRELYEEAHIPGARQIALDDISTPHVHGAELMLEMPATRILREALVVRGVSDDSRIVVYFADDWITGASRVVFTLDYLGLGDQTVWLDGGLNWRRCPTSSAPSSCACRGTCGSPARSSIRRWTTARRPTTPPR